MSGNDQASGHIFDGETGERRRPAFRLASGQGRHRHVQHASLQIGYAARGGSSGRGRRQDDVHAAMAGNVNVPCRGETWLADAHARLGGHLCIVILAFSIIEIGQIANGVIFALIRFKRAGVILIGTLDCTASGDGG